MSLSSLSAQLASINASAALSKNVGSSLPTSKRHQDAVGRGVSHSVQHGHSITPSGKFKPSVLYADSKAASDVPLTTLRENCVSSLRQLTKLTSNETLSSPQFLQTLAGVHSLSFERGMATRAENEKMDGIIQELLNLVSTAMGESVCFSSCLHVLEYLVRRYDIHARPETAEYLLISTLPHHEQPVFCRVLQLINLASLPTWTFLRPHAQKGLPPPNRNVLSKRASKDTTLIKHCCQLAKTVSAIHQEEESGGNVRTGVSRVISFCAAVLVEAMELQTAKQGSIDEATLRCILPYVLSACGNDDLALACPDWRGFGLVMASCIAEKCVLGDHPRQVLSTTLVKGAIQTEQSLKENLGQDAVVEMVADSILTLMSVLSQSCKGTTNSKLVTVSSDVIGYDLPVETYQALSKLQTLPMVLGHIYSVRDLVVTPFVATLVALGLSRMPNEKSSFKHISNLIEQVQLRPLWKDDTLTASVVVAVIRLFATMPEEECTPAVTKQCQAVLKALRNIHPTACDAGTADAITSLSDKRERIAALLGLSRGDDSDVEMDDTTSVNRLLPPRVALEHADASVRLKAIERLLEEEPSRTDDGESLEQALLRHFLVEEDLEVVVASGAAVTKLVENESFAVTEKFAQGCLEALRKWAIQHGSPQEKKSKKKKKKKHKKKSKKEASHDEDKAITVALSDKRVRVVELALGLAGLVIRSMLDSMDDNDSVKLFQIQSQLFQGVVAHLDLVIGNEEHASNAHYEQIASKSVGALFYALGVKGSATMAKATNVLLTKDVLLDGLRNCVTETDAKRLKKINTGLFRRYLRVYLIAMTESLNKAKTKSGKAISRAVMDALKTTLFVVSSPSMAADLGNRDTETLSGCLRACANRAKLIEAGLFLSSVAELAAVSSSQVYQDVSVPSILCLCEDFASACQISKMTILMEGALMPDLPNIAVSRLLSITSKCITSDPKPSAASVTDITIYVLALLGHTEQIIRKAVVGLLSTMKENLAKSSGDGNCSDDDLFREYVCHLVGDSSDKSSLAASILMDGASSLPSLLTRGLAKSEDQQKLRIEILRRCYLCACSVCPSKAGDSQKEWLPLRDRAGGCRAASLVLSALELAGEANFPLSDRFEYAGNDILNALIQEESSSGDYDVTGPLSDLVHSVTRMIKGVTLDDSTSVDSEVSTMIISTGPNARGTRARSYSVGRSAGASVVDPYPKKMYDAILKCLSYGGKSGDASTLRKGICDAIVRDVFQSQSWRGGVYRKMKKNTRRELLLSMLVLRNAEVIDGVGKAFLGLSVDAADISYLIREEGTDKEKLDSIIFLLDYIHAHAERLVGSTEYVELVSLLFETLEVLSSSDDMEDRDDEEVEFVRQSVLSILVTLIRNASARDREQRKKKLTKKDLSKYASFLVMLVGGTSTGSKSIRPLIFARSKALALSLIASLCPEHPASLVQSLVPAMLASVSSESGHSVSRESRNAFKTLVPVFHKYANKAGLSLFDLFHSFFVETAKINNDKTKFEMHANMVGAILVIPSEDLGDRAPVGCFVAATLAFDVHNNADSSNQRKHEQRMTSSATFACEVLLLPPPITQLQSLSQLIGYANGFLLSLADGDQIANQRKVSIECHIEQLEKSVWPGTASSDRETLVLRTTAAILSVIQNCISCTSVADLIGKGDGAESKLSLLVWQDLLILQSTSMFVQSASQGKATDSDVEGKGSDALLWQECQSLTDACLEKMQSLLPAHLFLASAAALIHDSSDPELCSRAVRFVSERAAETDSDSPEASLFLELLPLLVEHLDFSAKAMKSSESDSSLVVQQSVLSAAEVLARTLCIPATKDISGSLEAFSAILKHASVLLKDLSAPFDRQDKVAAALDSSSCQLLCSAALCASTLIRLLKVRSLPLLPDIAGPLTAVLSAVNQMLSQDEEQQHNSVRRNQASILHVSILRALAAVTDCLAQFLGPYLDGLFSPSCLFSPSLRSEYGENQLAVKTMTVQLSSTMSKKIPSRQLIPCLCKSLPECKDQKEVQAMLSMLRESVEHSPKGELPALRSWLLKALTFAYEFPKDGNEGSVVLVDEANRALLAFVMKLSEAQLRPLYAKLREWRGDLNAEMDDPFSAWKLYSFWSLSAVLSSELRTIFLPCLSTVSSDAVHELAFAVAQLCQTKASKKTADGKKKQRLETVNGEGSRPLWFLKPLLQCLEPAFHADASEGGKWVRADDSQRYHALLFPLAKLLELRSSSSSLIISASKEDSSSSNIYNEIVHGVEGEPGSVIGCLTALASAAGNEQLWKPLNHAVLEACGNETRAEVRNAGVSCLLSLIKALGEEYMVLLPECLPVLSELLEDADEETAGLAQECVSIGEDLLGESLTDSLR